MKTILSFGLGTMAFSYLFVSMSNHTWNIMRYSQESTYWLGCLTALGFIAGCLVKVLGLDQGFNWNEPEKPIKK